MADKGKSLSKGGVYYLIYNVLNMAFPFITGVYVARKLLSANIGEVAAAQNLATYFTILAFLGIPTYGLREIAKVRNDKEKRNLVFSELYVINLISTIVFCALYFALILAVPKYSENFKLYAITGIAIALNAFNISWMYEGMEEFRFISIRNLVFKAASFLLLVLLVRKTEDYMKYAVVTVLGTAGNYIVNMIYSPRFAKLSFHDLNLRRHMRAILYLVMVNLAIEIYSLMDITMMNYMSSAESIAYYKYGIGIHRILLQVVNTFTMVLVPRISYYYKENRKEDFNLLVSKGMKLIILTAVPMIIGIQFVSNFLIPKLYGEEYLPSAIVLRMFSVLLLISPTGYLLGSRMLLVTDHEKKMVICVGSGAVVNLIGNAILIPILHEYGATIASIISEIVVMMVYVYFGRKYFNLIKMKGTIWKTAAAGFAMTAVLLACSFLEINEWMKLIVQVAMAVATYLVAMVLMKEDTISQYTNAIRKRVMHRFTHRGTGV